MIQKVKTTKFVVDGVVYDDEKAARRAALIAWFYQVGFVDAISESAADSIIDDPEGFRAVVAPVLRKPRGPRKKKVEAVAPADEPVSALEYQYQSNWPDDDEAEAA